MSYTLGVSSGSKVLTPEDIEMITSGTTPTGASSSGPTLRPWPGSNPTAAPIASTSTGTSGMGKPTGSSTGHNIVGAPSGTGIVSGTTKPTAGMSTKPTGTSTGRNQVQGSVPSGTTPETPSPESPTSGGAPAESWLSQYKWYLVGGGAVVVAGLAVLLVLRSKKTAPVTAGLGDYAYTTAKAVRKAFWEQFPKLPRKKITNYAGTGKMYQTDTRVAFVDWRDFLQKDGLISQELAQRVTID